VTADGPPLSAVLFQMTTGTMVSQALPGLRTSAPADAQIASQPGFIVQMHWIG
jgi:hypothetical protein